MQPTLLKGSTGEVNSTLLDGVSKRLCGRIVFASGQIGPGSWLFICILGGKE